MRLILFSNLDLAGVNIARNLASITGLKPVHLDELEGSQKGEFHLVEIEGSLVDLELRGDGIEWALCLSKHKSSSGMGCLTAHTPGNPAFTAALGGRPNSLGVSNPPLQSMLIRELKNE
ncbi:MAG: D-aminoacyl-tRNA deacylase, partial [Candidatus Verstraetearchaeota archaeon]|nr:D-aminoacyl-tRNA deacylase [Candidatus Verstraetearchaeota archaeon]